MKKLSVLILAPTYPECGNIIKQNHIHNQLIYYKKHDLTPTVIDLSPVRHGIVKEDFYGVEVIRFGILSRGIVRSFLFRLIYNYHLRRLLTKILPYYDLVHIHNAMTHLLPVIDLLRSKPLLFTCHGDDVYPSKIKILEVNRRKLLSAADIITAVSTYTKNLVHHYVEDMVKVAYVPNGVREDVFSGLATVTQKAARQKLNLPVDAKIILMACSLIERKGVIQVLEAFSIVRAKLPDVFLVVIGNGDLKEKMLTIIEERKLTPFVKMINYVDDDTTMALYYKASDLYVMLSKTVEHSHGAGVEGFGISYIDANAAGIPVIGGRSGGVESAIIDGKTGFLVQPDTLTTVNDLTEKILLLLQNDSLRDQLGQYGKDRVFQELTWNNNVEKIRSLYVEALNMKCI